MKNKAGLLTGVIILVIAGVYYMSSARTVTGAPVPTADATAAGTPPATAPVTAKRNASPDPYYDDAAAQHDFYQGSKDFIQRDAARDAELAALNPGWEIAQLWPQPGSSRPILAACQGDDRKIYFLTRDVLDYQLMVFDGSETALAATIPLFRDDNPINFLSMEICNGRIVIAARNFLFVGRTGEKRLHRIGNLTQMINQAFAVRDRIYILSDKQLISCDWEGGGRTVHFADSQESKILPEQKADPDLIMLQGFAGADDNELILCSMSGSFAGATLWKYDVAQRRLTLWMIPPDRRTMIAFQKIGPEFFGTGMYGDNANVFYRFDVAAGPPPAISAVRDLPGLRRRIISDDFSVRPETAVLRDKHRIEGDYKIVGGWLIVTGWFKILLKDSLYRPANRPGAATAIKLAEYPADSPLKFPAVHDFYPAPDGKTLIAVEFNRLTALKRKE